MRILVDMDGIIVDLLSDCLATYNRRWDDSLTVEDIRSWHLHEWVRPDVGHKVYSIFEKPGFFRDLPPIPGAIEGVTSLVESGHEVLICTAAANGDSAKDKIHWVEEHFAHLRWNRKNMIIAHEKHWVSADLLIDDSPINLSKWTTSKWAIAYPYNPGVPGVWYAGSYAEPEVAWSAIARKLT